MTQATPSIITSRRDAKNFAQRALRGDGIPVIPHDKKLPTGLAVRAVSGGVERDFKVALKVYFSRQYCGMVLYDGNYWISYDLADAFHSKPAPVVLYLAAMFEGSRTYDPQMGGGSMFS